MTDGLGVSPKIASIATTHPVHVRRKCGFCPGPQDGMKVGRHQAVTKDVNISTTAATIKQVDKALVVCGLGKDHTLIVATVDDVIDLSGNDRARLTRHDWLPGEEATHVPH